MGGMDFCVFNDCMDEAEWMDEMDEFGLAR